MRQGALGDGRFRGSDLRVNKVLEKELKFTTNCDNKYRVGREAAVEEVGD